jgi:hypothetical protein
MEGAFDGREAFTAHARRFSKDAFKERVLRVLSERKRI